MAVSQWEMEHLLRHPPIMCDICNKQVAASSKVWTCENGRRTVLHSVAYDVCQPCFDLHAHGREQAPHDEPDADDDSDINECSDFMFSDDESDSSPGSDISEEIEPGEAHNDVSPEVAQDVVRALSAFGKMRILHTQVLNVLRDLPESTWKESFSLSMMVEAISSYAEFQLEDPEFNQVLAGLIVSRGLKHVKAFELAKLAKPLAKALARKRGIFGPSLAQAVWALPRLGLSDDVEKILEVSSGAVLAPGDQAQQLRRLAESCESPGLQAPRKL
eukprot:g25098.t1